MQLTNMLFKTPESKHGGDLVAFNIWRGRDHGLPGYNAYRELLGLRKAKSFTWEGSSRSIKTQVFSPFSGSKTV